MKATMTLALSAVLMLASGGPAAAAISEVASEVGIAQTTRTFSVNSADFDSDGKDDLFLVRHNPDEPKNLPPSTLYRNVGARFANFITAGFGHTDKHGCAWGDTNSDGRPDLFCTVGFSQFSVNELWIQNRDHSFTNRAKELGLTRDTHGRYRYATFINANGDARPDLYIARYTGSCFCGTYGGDSFPNELWINQGSSFRRASEFGLNQPIGAKKDNATCSQAVDYDRDGDEDLLVCGWKSLRLYRNNSGTGFTDVTAAKGVGGNVSDARLIDVTRDGIRDLVRLTSQSLTVQPGTGTGWGAVSFSAPVTAGEALAFGDFDGAGGVDIYALSSRGPDNIDDPDALFLNTGGGYNKVAIAATSGSGDDVTALDYDDDGRTDFAVTNGDRKKAGPVQLFTWR
jgi:FG-GAP-like repeat